MSAVIIRENDALANVSLIKDEQLIILTKMVMQLDLIVMKLGLLLGIAAA